jgi:DNA-binding beta-propeller fold protein YncE
VSPELGTQLAGYRIDGVVGRGGMGVVYRATELALDRPVALKLIAPELAHDRSFRERFLRESRLAASLDHPGILPVYRAGEAGGDLYLATRYVDGTDLRAILAEEGALPPERALALVGQVAEALDAAHRRGLVHRDVKPGNVLVDASDHCYLCDFGLTKQLGDGGTTASGLLAGSLDYLAPEQIRRGKVDGRTDEYALACVLYECLSGAPPFRRETEAQTLWAHMQDEPPQLAAHPELAAVFAGGLAKEAAQRYETCAAFVDDARSELGLGTSPTGVRRRRLRVGRRLVLAGAALIAAAAAAVAFALTLGSEGGIVVPPNSLAAIDPVSRTVVAAIPVGAAPTTVAASDDWVWVINSNDGAGTISRIDPSSRRVVKTFSVFGRPNDLLAAADALWVGTEERVFRIDPSSDLEDGSWPLPNAEESSPFVFDAGDGYLAYGANTVWAASFRAISRIDPPTSELVPGTSAVWGRLAYGFGSIWTIGLEPRLVRLAPATLRPQATIELSFGSSDVTVGEGSVWLPDHRGHQVWQVDPARNVVEDSYDVGGRTVAVAVGAGAVWAPSDDGALVRIDPTTGETERIEVGGAPTGVAVGASLVWVSVR